MKNYYELLGVPSSASTEDIKRAFRKEIARYHPDKVQHLGREFQELASVRAAELTEAYRILMDVQLRTDHDRQLKAAGSTGTGTPAAPASTPSARATPRGTESTRPSETVPPPEPAGRSGFTEERARRDDVVRKATLVRFRTAVESALGGVSVVGGRGFDVVLASTPKRGLLRKQGSPTCVCGRFVTRVDPDVVRDTWPLAAKLAGYPSVLVFLMGTGLASARDLGAVINEQRRKGPRGSTASIVMVPVDVRDWEALVPADAPAAVKSILEKLRAHS